jgi:hypothetical protein
MDLEFQKIPVDWIPQIFTIWHSLTSHKTSTFIYTAVRTQNIAVFSFSCKAINTTKTDFEFGIQTWILRKLYMKDTNCTNEIL